MTLSISDPNDRTIWVPSLNTACGVAEYSMSLARHMRGGGLRLSSGPPDLHSTRLVHVQYHSKRFDDTSLAGYVHSARETASSAIVITEHDVWNETRLWEQEADALVALTKAGVNEIRARYPEKHVEWIPHGCPVPVVPANRRRGRTIGAFGLLNEYKGFWRLLDVVKEISGTTLILISHPTKPWLEAEWRRDIEGLPVRWISRYMSERKVTQLLAAEADVLAFPYDDVPYHSASGAVRVGLATGIPVVTSTAEWFAELGDAVYRVDDFSEGVLRLLEDSPLRERTIEAARTYCEEHSWPRIAGRHQALWQQLEQKSY